MKKFLLATWLCLPVAGWAYHQGPGQERAKLDKVDAAISQADLDMKAGNHDAALLGYENALKELPEDAKQESYRIRLLLNKLRMVHKDLPKAQEELAELVEDMVKDPESNAEVLHEARRAYANAQYYITFQMRLEGYTREDWEPEIENARQVYRLLAEEADRNGDTALALQCREDLESTVKLARLDLQDLQGLPLPNQ